VPASSALGAEFGIAGFTASMLDAEGDAETLAGSHPDRLQIDFALNLEGTTARDLEFDMPVGLGGNPAAVPQCPRQIYENKEECPPESQVGAFEAVQSGGGTVKLPLFELEPKPDQFIAFGSTPAAAVSLKTELRPDDFGITFKSNDLPAEPIAAGHFELWGVPADHQEGTAIPRRPLLTAPSRCGPVSFVFRTRSQGEGAPWLSASTDTGAPLTGCESLDFAPQLGMGLSNPVVDSPTGLQLDLSMPEEEEGSERAAAEIEDVTVELPSGIGVSPGGVEGLVACTDAQLSLKSSAEASCPQSSKVGTAEFASPALGSPLVGTIYLGEGHPGQRFRTFVVIPGPGIVLKVVSTLRADPVTGRLSTVLNGLPPVALRRISLSFDGGPRALLASPLACGPATSFAKFKPIGGGPAVESTASVMVASRTAAGECAGPPPFAPRLTTQSSSRKAGHATTFSTTLSRQPGEQLPRRFSATLPAGMSAKLGAVKVCPAAAATADACPLDSKIGGVVAEIGSGANPAVLRGNVYITDPYRRAPFGILLELRGVIGPFDLGAIAMRGTAELDGRSGRLTVSTDSLPEQVEGVPVRLQSMELAMDRPGFVRNPTSCSAKSTDAALESQSGARVTVSSPLKLYGCRRLGFKPGIEMAFLGRSEMRKHGSPGLRVTLRPRPGDTSLRGMELLLPPGLRFAVAGVKQICSRSDAIDGTCPSGSRVGSASARSSLLGKPLSGSLYIAQPSGNGPPDIWTSLTALGVQMGIKGETSARDGHFVTKLSDLPDIPLSEFTMRLGGSGNRILSLDRSPCSQGRPRRFASTVSLTGQDGARRRSRSVIGGVRPRCTAPSRSGANAQRRTPPPVDPE
jgi:hypothetical protein